MNDVQRSFVVCLGTPRSGMGVLTNCLRLYRHQQFVDDHDMAGAATINRVLLNNLGYSEYMIGSLPQGWMQTHSACRAREQIKVFLSKVQGHVFLSDFLLCRTAPLWLEIFNEEGIHPVFVHTLRHPYEVALSLKNNHQIELSRGHLIWLSCIIDILKLNGLDSYRHKIITYDQLLADPVSTTCYILDESLDVSIANSQDILYYVKPTLKNYHAGEMKTAEPYDETLLSYLKIYDYLRLQTNTLKLETNRYNKKSVFHSYDNSDVLDCRVEKNSLFPVKSGNTALNKSPKEHEFINDCEIFPGLKIIEPLLSALNQKDYHIGSSFFNQTVEPTFYVQFEISSTETSARTIKNIPLLENQWQNISLSFPRLQISHNSRLTLRPINKPGFVKIAEIHLIRDDRNSTVWIARTIKDFNQFAVNGAMFRMNSPENMVLLVTGEDACLELPDTYCDFPATLSIRMKPSKNLNLIRNYLPIQSLNYSGYGVGTIHHLSCSGGTIISKCLAAMPSVVLLSEMNPYSNMRGSIKFDPTGPLQYFKNSYPDLYKPDKEKAKVDFYEQLSHIIECCKEHNKFLIFRDHSHSDYLYNETVRYPSLFTLLNELFEVKALVTLRDPIDSYLSMRINFPNVTDVRDFDTYCKRVLTFLDHHNFADVLLYEDFVNDPDTVLRNACSKYGIAFDPSYRDTFHHFALTGDSGRGKAHKTIIKLKRRSFDDELDEQIEGSSHYKLIIQKYYHNHARLWKTNSSSNIRQHSQPEETSNRPRIKGKF